MSLPYPEEVETGELKSRHPEPRITFDVEASVEDNIRFSGSTVELFGVQYRVEDARAAEALVERYRNYVTKHFNERVSAPDGEVWQGFAERASAQLYQHPILDDGVLDMFRMTIDSL